MGRSKETAAKNDIGRLSQAEWDEHLFIEPGECSAGDLSEAMIQISVYNKGFFKSDLIGYFAVAATKIYSRKDHVLHN